MAGLTRRTCPSCSLIRDRSSRTTARVKLRTRISDPGADVLGCDQMPDPLDEDVRLSGSGASENELPRVDRRFGDLPLLIGQSHRNRSRVEHDGFRHGRVHDRARPAWPCRPTGSRTSSKPTIVSKSTTAALASGSSSVRTGESSVMHISACVLDEIELSDEDEFRVLRSLNERNRSLPYGKFFFDADGRRDPSRVRAARRSHAGRRVHERPDDRRKACRRSRRRPQGRARPGSSSRRPQDFTPRSADCLGRRSVPEVVELVEGELLAELFDVVGDVDEQASLGAAVARATQARARSSAGRRWGRRSGVRCKRHGHGARRSRRRARCSS